MYPVRRGHQLKKNPPYEKSASDNSFPEQKTGAFSEPDSDKPDENILGDSKFKKVGGGKDERSDRLPAIHTGYMQEAHRILWGLPAGETKGAKRHAVSTSVGSMAVYE